MVLGHEPRQTTSNLGHLNKPSIQVMPIFDNVFKTLFCILKTYKCPFSDLIFSILILFTINFSCAFKDDYGSIVANVRFAHIWVSL